MIDLQQNGHDFDLKLSGSIDENIDFSQIQIPEEATRLFVDLGGVQMMNSSGLRSWVRWARQLPRKTQVVFRHCPTHVVHQINILEGFVPLGGRIESFYVPYFCEDCRQEDYLLATRGEDFQEDNVDAKGFNRIPEHRNCPQCGSSMEQDVLKNKFYNFLKYRP